MGVRGWGDMRKGLQAKECRLTPESERQGNGSLQKKHRWTDTLVFVWWGSFQTSEPTPAG